MQQKLRGKNNAVRGAAGAVVACMVTGDMTDGFKP